MKHVFIINPICDRKNQKKLLTDIRKYFGQKMFEYGECLIYFTKFPGDAVSYIKKIAKSGEEMTVYACGGDGTVSEASYAASGCENIRLAVIPIGTGNDFVRHFGGKKRFLNLKAQMKGKVIKSDIMMINAQGEKGSCSRFASINITNMGFDEKVASTVAHLRDFPLMKKSISYTLAVAVNLFKYPMEYLHMKFDDGSLYEGKVLLAAFANASYYGGGYKAAARAKTDDGLMEVIIVKPLKRIEFISLIGKYKKGRILDDAELKKHIIYKRCKTVSISRPGAAFNICADGEIKSVTSAVIGMVPLSVNLVIP